MQSTAVTNTEKKLVFTNNDVYHPLYPLLHQCIRATRSDWSRDIMEDVRKAFPSPKGFKHEFSHWDENGFSVERLEVDNEETYDVLVSIVQRHTVK